MPIHRILSVVYSRPFREARLDFKYIIFFMYTTSVYYMSNSQSNDVRSILGRKL